MGMVINGMIKDFFFITARIECSNDFCLLGRLKIYMFADVRRVFLEPPCGHSWDRSQLISSHRWPAST